MITYPCKKGTIVVDKDTVTIRKTTTLTPLVLDMNHLRSSTPEALSRIIGAHLYYSIDESSEIAVQILKVTK